MARCPRLAATRKSSPAADTRNAKRTQAHFPRTFTPPAARAARAEPRLPLPHCRRQAAPATGGSGGSGPRLGRAATRRSAPAKAASGTAKTLARRKPKSSRRWPCGCERQCRYGKPALSREKRGRRRGKAWGVMRSGPLTQVLRRDFRGTCSTQPERRPPRTGSSRAATPAGRGPPARDAATVGSGSPADRRRTGNRCESDS
jgi:hypothetical protein